MKLAMTNFSLNRPWLIVLLSVFMTIIFGAQFPKVHFDNDPENMLSENEHVRIFHHEVKEKYSLYDFVIVGVVNTEHPDGIFNVDTLGKVNDLTSQLLSLQPNEDGLPTVTTPKSGNRAAKTFSMDLLPDSTWERVLGVAFNHNPNNLFTDEGESSIISREVIAPSVVDNIKQAGLGSLKIEYLMESVPTTREEALTIRDDAMNNPLYAGTLVSEDEKAVNIYIPIKSKHFSYNVANLVKELTKDWVGADKVYITGLPVAEDTFGVEMLVQMATSAPLAGVMIFFLLLFFFRRFSLIIAPMFVAGISVISTMGLLIGLGFDVHIMSSMIAIFLMPIAVADSVHVLSEFYDTYHRFNDRAKTVKYVIGHLFRPMLFTSLTTMAGFGSLATTPIPPVQVFGLHVAFGVFLAWLLTMTFVPAYIMLFVPQKTLDSIGRMNEKREEKPGPLTKFLEVLGSFGYLRWKFILTTTVAVIIVAAYGIGQISVNDNPVKWFTEDHPIRVADKVLNDHFGGTYTAYLTLSGEEKTADDCAGTLVLVKDRANERFASSSPTGAEHFAQAVSDMTQAGGCDIKPLLADLTNIASTIDESVTASWNLIADEINYLEIDGLNFDKMMTTIRSIDGVNSADVDTFITEMENQKSLLGEDLLDAGLDVTDRFTSLSFRDFVFEMEAELTAPLFKQPEVLAYVDGLQNYLIENPMVGKTSSAVDALKKANYELNFVAAPANASTKELATYKERNAANYGIPDSASGNGQVFVQLEGMKKKDSLFHLVTKDYQEANLWIQLKSGDNKDMESVVADVEEYIAAHQPPVAVKAEWAGLTYLNVVWQEKMVNGMLTSLLSSFAVVLVMMMILFRSPIYGVLAMIPLTVTISFIYGLIGLVGKDYDMPVAVLSALTLGLSVDFAIHFLERAREMQKELGSWKKAAAQMFKEPAMAISRNAIIISIGFTPLLVAPLVPYKTVGFFLATIMAVSWLSTLFILPALMTVLRKFVFPGNTDE